MEKIRTHHKHGEGKKLAYLALITGIGVGLNLPVLPNFIKTILSTNTFVSVFYSTMAVIMLLGALISTYVFKKIDRAKIVKGSLLIVSAAFMLLVFTTRIHALTFLNSLHVIFTLFIAMGLSLYVRDFAKSKSLGEEEGKYFRYSNFGYLIGPLFGGFAGAYALQGGASKFALNHTGTLSAIIGMPIATTVELLEQMGIEVEANPVQVEYDLLGMKVGIT